MSDISKVDGISLDLEKQNIDKLKELFPEAVEEGKINFDMLRTMLGDEVDDSREKYQFTWNGKAKAIKMAQTPSSATLRPCKGKSKNWDTTENLYIEGDNLEVLKQLQKTFYEKIDLIFIDPPYNTGYDFVYKDSFEDTIQNYKKQTSQNYSSNPETNGKFHTDWLNMMYPRLLLAKNLLSRKGAIFITIDHNEHANLKEICDEIFGCNCFIADMVWQSSDNSNNNALTFSEDHNSILVYAKSPNWKPNFINDPEKRKHFKNPDNDPRGPWFDGNPVNNPGLRTNLQFDLTTPSGKIIKHPQNGWRWSKETMEVKFKTGELRFSDDETRVIRRTYLNELEGLPPSTLCLDFEKTGHTRKAKYELKKLFPELPVTSLFSTPKPTLLIEYLMEIGCSKDSTILDFFSGSASTAHAIMKANYNKKYNRKYILVQIPEPCIKNPDFSNLCEMGEERIRRAGEQIKAEWEKEHPSDGLFESDEEFTTDIGFKVFKLDSSNLYEWDSSLKLNEKDLVEKYGKVFKLERSSEDIIYEIMLKYGVFDKKVEKIKVNDKTMYRVGKRYMIICLESEITLEDIKAIGELSPKTVVFNESSFKGDNEKINALTNLKNVGVEDIKCI